MQCFQRVKDTLGAHKIAAIFHLCQRIAIAIVAKWRCLVHSARVRAAKRHTQPQPQEMWKHRVCTNVWSSSVPDATRSRETDRSSRSQNTHFSTPDKFRLRFIVLMGRWRAVKYFIEKVLCCNVCGNHSIFPGQRLSFRPRHPRTLK